MSESNWNAWISISALHSEYASLEIIRKPKCNIQMDLKILIIYSFTCSGSIFIAEVSLEFSRLIDNPWISRYWAVFVFTYFHNSFPNLKVVSLIDFLSCKDNSSPPSLCLISAGTDYWVPIMKHFPPVVRVKLNAFLNLNHYD